MDYADVKMVRPEDGKPRLFDVLVSSDGGHTWKRLATRGSSIHSYTDGDFPVLSVDLMIRSSQPTMVEDCL